MNDEYIKRYEEELIIFLSLCSENDRGFISIPKNKRKTEDFARLIFINAILGFKKVLLSIFAESGNRATKIIAYLEEVKKKPTIIENWMDDFINKITLPDLRKLTSEFWEERRHIIHKEDFNIGQLMR